MYSSEGKGGESEERKEDVKKRNKEI